MRSEFPQVRFGPHLRNTYGMELANVAAGLRQGIDEFDASPSGIGGCPFAPGAAGSAVSRALGWAA